MKKILEFDGPETLGIISPYFSKNSGDFRGYSIARYTSLLLNSFPKNQKMVVFCEMKEGNKTLYQGSENILVVPSYKFNSANFSAEVLRKVRNFNRIKDFLIQFEFSIFGGKKVIPSVLLAILGLKLFGKNISITIHQVATNLNELSGHLGLQRNSIKTHLLNLSLNIFYRTIGMLSNKVIVHDDLLKTRLSKYVNRNKIMVIQHAIGDENIKNITSKLTNVARREFGFNKKDKVVAVYGYRSWYKGTDWIVKTVKELSDVAPKKNLKLLVAGGASPTLKDTASYKSFDRKLKTVIKKANGVVKVTGFIPEKDVWKIFAASDVVVFPYRTRMSASGAFALTLAYKKPFLVSSHFATGSEIDFSRNIFELNTFSLEMALDRITIIDSQNLIKERSWANIASLYLSKIKDARINFAYGTSQKALAVAEA